MVFCLEVAKADLVQMRLRQELQAFGVEGRNGVEYYYQTEYVCCRQAGHILCVFGRYAHGDSLGWLARK
jgi:hypothetical protein